MSGTWIDTKTGKVVNSQPEEGIQLASPNLDEVGPEEKRSIEIAKAAVDSDKGRDEELAAAQPALDDRHDRNRGTTPADDAAEDSKTVTSASAAPKGKK